MPKTIDKAEAERWLMSELFVPVPVIAAVLQTSRNLAYKAIKDGTIPSVRVGGRLRVPTKPYRDACAAKVA